MSSTADWSRFVNEKLYLANLQLERMSAIQKNACNEAGFPKDANAPRKADVAKKESMLLSDSFMPKRAEYLSSFWASVSFIHSAYQGVLAELALYHQCRDAVGSLESLSRLVGADKQEVVRLSELATTKESWLWYLLSLDAFYHSPSARVSFELDKVDKSSNAEPVEITATKTRQYSDAIIATSGADANIALGSGQSISPLKLDWHLTELTEDVLQNILLGLKEFNNEIRTHAMEW